MAGYHTLHISIHSLVNVCFPCLSGSMKQGKCFPLKCSPHCKLALNNLQFAWLTKNICTEIMLLKGINEHVVFLVHEGDTE